MPSALSEPRLKFDLPPELEAHEPPEARGLRRDEVRLMVSYRGSGQLRHVQFQRLPDFLPAGTVLVLNTSATLPAQLSGLRSDGSPILLHLSTRLPGRLEELWTVEMRRPTSSGSARLLDGRLGEVLFLPEGGSAHLLDAYPMPAQLCLESGCRLWVARLRLPAPLPAYLKRYGRPIRYSHVKRDWPLSFYQTAYAGTPGSAEMPSAGRPFTPALLTRLQASGVELAKVLLHTGVSSLEADEAPFAEWFEVPARAAASVNRARRERRPVIAVGTTAVRALESAVDQAGLVQPKRGWTELIVTPGLGVRAIDGLISGWHAPEASHLLMLEAIEGRPLLEASYAAALARGYLWHEFGDSQLVLP